MFKNLVSKLNKYNELKVTVTMYNCFGLKIDTEKGLYGIDELKIAIEKLVHQIEYAGEYAITMSAKDQYKGEFLRNCRVNKDNAEVTILGEYNTLSKLIAEPTIISESENRDVFSFGDTLGMMHRDTFLEIATLDNKTLEILNVADISIAIPKENENWVESITKLLEKAGMSKQFYSNTEIKAINVFMDKILRHS